MKSFVAAFAVLVLLTASPAFATGSVHHNEEEDVTNTLNQQQQQQQQQHQYQDQDQHQSNWSNNDNDNWNKNENDNNNWNTNKNNNWNNNTNNNTNTNTNTNNNTNNNDNKNTNTNTSSAVSQSNNTNANSADNSGNSQSVKFENPHQVGSISSFVAASGPCTGAAASVSGGFTMFSFGIGYSALEAECQKREAIRLGFTSGNPQAEAVALKVFMSLDAVKKVLEEEEKNKQQ